MQNFIVANRGLDQMPEEQIQRARTHHLEHLRNSIIPAKQTLIAAMRVFRDSTGSLLGHSLTQAIFFERLYDVTPKDYKSWNRNRKKSYETARSVYRQRYNEVLPKCTYQTLMQHERDKFDALLKMLTDYVDMINDATRDVEIAFSIPHDGKPDSYLTFDIDPPLRSVYDVELERRREIRDKKIVLRSNECPECRTNEYVMSTVLDSVCVKCGTVIASSQIDETKDAHPFGTLFNKEQRGGFYVMTENFMKAIDHIEATDTPTNDKVPPEVKDQLRQYINQNFAKSRVTINLVRRVLRQMGQSKYYPQAPSLVVYITGETIPKCTEEQRSMLRDMHVAYYDAFLHCPLSIRKRKSTLVNNYLAYKFYQMIGLMDRTRYIRMLKGPNVLRKHDRAMRWIVNYIRTETKEKEKVERGESYWQWYDTIYEPE